MCGGHSVNRLVALVASESTQAQDTERHPGGHSHSRPVMEQQVKLMYARGEIGAEAFHRLLDMARAGDLKPDDLMAFQSRRVDVPLPAQRDQRLRRESLSTHLDQLQQQRIRLEAACAETEGSIRRLRLDAARLYQQAESAESDSKGASPESEAAQVLSRTREEALARARSVEDRIGHITERLSTLRTQLDELAAQEKLLQRTM